jgi:hypothetical protein
LTYFMKNSLSAFLTMLWDSYILKRSSSLSSHCSFIGCNPRKWTLNSHWGWPNHCSLADWTQFSSARLWGRFMTNNPKQCYTLPQSRRWGPPNPLRQVWWDGSVQLSRKLSSSSRICRVRSAYIRWFWSWKPRISSAQLIHCPFHPLCIPFSSDTQSTDSIDQHSSHSLVSESSCLGWTGKLLLISAYCS